MKIADIVKEFEKYIVIKDEWGVRLILATLLGNALIRRDPLWLILVAPSSGGKSTLLAPAAAVPSVFFLDDLTEKTFLSGYKIKGKEASLLKLIGSGVMCFSDFTTILAKNPMSRGEILSQLRLVYDGTFSKRTGVGEVSWKGKMGCIAAATPDVYQILEQSRSMGERFIYYTLDQPTDQEIVHKQEEVKMSSKEITEEIMPMYREYCEEVNKFVKENGMPDLSMTKDQQERVHRAAIFCVSAKATVHLDFKTNQPDSLVSRPGVGRDRKMFNTLLHSLQVMKAYETNDINATVDDDMIRLVEKCAYASVSRERRKVLEILTKYKEPMGGTQIGATDGFGLPKEAVDKYLFALHAVGLIDRNTEIKPYTWTIESEETKDFIRGVADITTTDNEVSDAPLDTAFEDDDQ